MGSTATVETNGATHSHDSADTSNDDHRRTGFTGEESFIG
jgi:hypothetical protein